MKKEKLQINSKVTYNPTIANLTLFYENHCVEIADGIYIYDEPMDSFLHNQCLLLIACVKVDFGKGPISLLVWDSNFRKCPKNIRKFFINHEIGHIINGDLIDDKKANIEHIKRLFGILPTMEVKADAFAASLMGSTKAKHILKYLALNTDLPLLTKFELMRRYAHIK